MVTRRNMKAPVTATHRRGQGRAVPNVAGHGLKLGAGQSAHIRAGTQKDLHVVSTVVQFVDKVGTNEAGGAGDEAVHALDYGKSHPI